jgi:hypothetical protein
MIRLTQTSTAQPAPQPQTAGQPRHPIPASGGRSAAAALRGLFERAFPRPSVRPRESDIERALLRALGGL